MSSISRRRNGLMALSVIGGSCLGCGLQPLDLKTGRLLLLLPETLPFLQITAEAVKSIGPSSSLPLIRAKVALPNRQRPATFLELFARAATKASIPGFTRIQRTVFPAEASYAIGPRFQL